MTTVPTAPSAGAVYDRGYRPYAGQLGGRRAARGALYRASLRRAVGLRRSWRQKVFPWLLLGVAAIPAIVWVGVAYITRNTPAEAVEIITYREYLGVSTALLAFVGLAAPDVLCPDRRNRTLPLIFSRPLTGNDYVVAKVGAIGSLVFGFSFLPQVVLYVGQLLVSDSALDYLRDNLDVLWQVPLATFTFALYFSALSCAIASLTTRRLIAAASLLILLLGSSALAAGLSESTGAPADRGGFEVEIDPEQGEALGGPGGGRIGADGQVSQTSIYVETDPSSAWGAANLLAVPLHVRDLIFEGEVTEPYLAGVDGAGLLAVGVYSFVVVTSLGVLVWRYRWLEP
jgi:ABC-2 type transport system permease protein